MWFAYNCCINFCQFSPFIYRLCEHPIQYYTNTLPIAEVDVAPVPPSPHPLPTPSKKKSFFFLFQVQEINIHVGLASKTQVSYFISKIDSNKTVLMRRIV